MTTKQWLNRAYRIDDRIKILETEKEQLLAKAAVVRAAPKEICVKASAENRTEGAYARYADSVTNYEKKIGILLRALYETKAEIVQVIADISNPAVQQLLSLRYLQFKRWDEIAAIMHFDVRHIFRLHKKALRAVSEKIKSGDIDSKTR